MNETRKKQGENYKDYISIMFRKKMNYTIIKQ